jgi:hypothetical protein
VVIGARFLDQRFRLSFDLKPQVPVHLRQHLCARLAMAAQHLP